MTVSSSVISRFIGLSLVCHVAVLAWIPDPLWFAGHHGQGAANSLSQARLMVSIAFVDENSQASDQQSGGDAHSLQVSETLIKATPKQTPDAPDPLKDQRPAMADTSMPSSEPQRPEAQVKPVEKADAARAESTLTASVKGKKAVDKKAVDIKAKAPAIAEKSRRNSPPDSESLKENVRLPVGVAEKTTPKTHPAAIAEPAAIADSPANAAKNLTEQAASQSPPVPRASQTQRYQMGAPHTPKPKYPSIAVKRRWQGEVLIAMQVNADGTPARVTVEKGSGYAVLDNSALKVLAKWRLAPSDEALETLYIPVIFRL